MSDRQEIAFCMGGVLGAIFGQHPMIVVVAALTAAILISFTREPEPEEEPS